MKHLIILKLYRFKKLGGDERIRRRADFRERDPGAFGYIEQ